MPGILVTDGEQRSALAIVRSLGRAGYRCTVCSGTGRSLAGASRHAASDVRVPDPGADPGGYAEAVEAAVRREGVDLVIPVTEAALLALLPARDRIPAPIPFPALAAVETICDKARVLAAAARLGIRVPGQVEIGAPGQAPPGGGFPLVLKPARSVFTAGDGTRRKTGVRWARSPGELREALEGYPVGAYPILLQEAIEGPGIGIFVLLHEGRLLARFSHRRLREKPPSGGVSVLRRSEPMDEALLEKSLALLQELGWSGVAMVEYKRDVRTGEPYLMEINGRFWGSLQLAIDAGVDFPRLLADVSFGRPVEPVLEYRTARTRWLWGDVDHLIAVWRDRRSTVSDRVRSLAGLLRAFGPGCRSEVFRWRDPAPFLRETKIWITDIL